MKRRTLLLSGGGLALAGLGLWSQRRPRQFERAASLEQSRALWLDDTQADRIEVHKAERRLSLQSGGFNFLNCGIALGFEPRGHKQREGDGRTPEGLYSIDYKNDRSAFFLSLRIAYPDAEDRARAAAAGEDPGGDIMIHGQPNWLAPGADEVLPGDWTLGCIAVSNGEMERIFAAVPLGTPVAIFP